MGNSVQHRGVVERIEGNVVIVAVETQSACAQCHAKGLCTEKGEKRSIEVKTDYATDYAVGERVVVALLDNKMGFSSIIWGYMFPLIVLLVAIAIGSSFGIGEGPTALGSIAAVALYYVVLYTLRHKIEKRIQFTIIKES